MVPFVHRIIIYNGSFKNNNKPLQGMAPPTCLS